MAVVLFVLTLLPLPGLVGILSQLCPICGALEKFLSPPKSGRCAKATDLLSSCISQSQYKVGSPADPSSLHSEVWGGGEECVLELCIWELLGETACTQASFALTQMYDDLCDPVLQLEIQVADPNFLFNRPPQGFTCSHLQKVYYSLEASSILSANSPRTLRLRPRGRREGLPTSFS